MKQDYPFGNHYRLQKKRLIITYAQFNEDLILAALLDSQKKGFYVDVGANHEEYHSVTKYFYDRGWRGINIEPIPWLHKEINKKRKRDVNLNIAISDKQGKLSFREYPEHDGLSALLTRKDLHKLHKNKPHKDYEVDVKTLTSVLEEFKANEISFIKIDVEGFEFEVLKSNDWSRFRPHIICIEANHQRKSWQNYLSKKNYKLFIFDGLNEYYIESSKISLLDGFAERAAELFASSVNGNAARAWHKDLEDITSLRSFAKKQDQQIKAFNERIQGQAAKIIELEKHSMQGKGYSKKIKIAIKALIIHYLPLIFKKSRK